jgi:hypothetical protein
VFAFIYGLFYLKENSCLLFQKPPSYVKCCLVWLLPASQPPNAHTVLLVLEDMENEAKGEKGQIRKKLGGIQKVERALELWTEKDEVEELKTWQKRRETKIKTS